jgi:hypothetical protein
MSVPQQKADPAGVLPVEELDSIDRYTFLEHYRYRKPFVLRGGAAHVPAFRKWTLEYLESRIAGITINPLMYEGDRRDYSRANFVEMTFADFCRELRAGNGKTLYWIAGPVSNNFWGGPGKGARINPELNMLVEDFALPGFLREPEIVYGQIILGTGRNGTVIHHDFGGEAKCLMQLQGEKHILLVPPQDAAHVGLHSITANKNFTLSAFDLRGRDFERITAQARVYEATIGPGDAIYWPSFWLHDVINRGALNMAINTPIDEVPVSPLLLRHLLAMNLRRLKKFDPGFCIDTAQVKRVESELMDFDVHTLWDLHMTYTREELS